MLGDVHSRRVSDSKGLLRGLGELTGLLGILCLSLLLLLPLKSNVLRIGSFTVIVLAVVGVDFNQFLDSLLSHLHRLNKFEYQVFGVLFDADFFVYGLLSFTSVGGMSRANRSYVVDGVDDLPDLFGALVLVANLFLKVLLQSAVFGTDVLQRTLNCLHLPLLIVEILLQLI